MTTGLELQAIIIYGLVILPTYFQIIHLDLCRSLQPGELTRRHWKRMEQAGIPERHGSCDVVAGRRSGKSEAMAALRWAEGWSTCLLWEGVGGAEDSMWKVCEEEEQLLRSELFNRTSRWDKRRWAELFNNRLEVKMLRRRWGGKLFSNRRGSIKMRQVLPLLLLCAPALQLNLGKSLW